MLGMFGLLLYNLSDDWWYGMCSECLALPLYHCLTTVVRCCSITFVRAVESVHFFDLLSLHSSCLEC